MAGRKAMKIESQDIRRAAHPLDVSVSDSPIRDTDGRVVEIVRIARDISTRKRTEHDLAQMRGLLHPTQQLSRVRGWEYELDPGRLMATVELYRISGLRRLVSGLPE